MKNISRAKAQRRKGNRQEDVRLSPSLRLSLRLCAFAGVLLFTLAALAQSPETRGVAELKKGDYDNAFKLLSARLVSKPEDVVAQRALLRVYMETGRYAEVEATAKRFLQKTPD